VGTIPLFIWDIKNTYNKEMECLVNPSCETLTTDGLVFYIPMIMIFAFILLWPLCLWKIITNVKSILNEK